MFPSPTSQTPACHCLLKSPSDAIYILEAVRQGFLPRCSRRLTGNERGRIGPGSVWVWEEEETNMRRWTDGRRWGASRVGAGGFLIYREVEGSGRGRHSTSPSLSPPRNRNGTEINPHQQPHPNFPPNIPQQPHLNGIVNVPSGSRNSRHNGLVKQTYSTTMHTPDSGGMKKFHVVAYYSKNDHNEPPLLRPHEIPQLSGLQIPPGIWADYQDPRRVEDGTTSTPASTSGGGGGGGGGSGNNRAVAYQQPSLSAMPQTTVQPGRNPYMHYSNSPYSQQPIGGPSQQQQPAPPPQMMHPGYPPPPPPPPGYYGPPPGHEHMQPPPPGMYGIYYHPDPYFRYANTAPPPPPPPPPQALPPPHQNDPNLGSTYEQQSRAPPSVATSAADRRTSVAPSKRSIPKHLHPSQPYPQGSPSRHQVGVIDPGLQGNPMNDRMHYMQQPMGGSPYAHSPNGHRGSTPVVYDVGAADGWQRDYQQPRSEEMQQNHQRLGLREPVIEQQQIHHQPLQVQPQQTATPPVQPPTISHSQKPEDSSTRSQEAPPSASPALLRSTAGYPSGGGEPTPDSAAGEQPGHQRATSGGGGGGENGSQLSGGGDLTLPPIRSPQIKDGWKPYPNGDAIDAETNVKSAPAPAPVLASEATITESTSPSASKSQNEQQRNAENGEVGENGKLIHGEDARQLRELSKMVTL